MTCESNNLNSWQPYEEAIAKFHKSPNQESAAHVRAAFIPFAASLLESEDDVREVIAALDRNIIGAVAGQHLGVL